MEPFEPKLATGYKVRIGFIVGLFALISLPLCAMALKRGVWWLWLIALGPLTLMAWALWRNYRRSPCLFDADGVLLRSGYRHAWSDYIEQRDVTYATASGATGLSHTELRFSDGVVPIFPAMYANLREIYLFLREIEVAAKAAPVEPAVPVTALELPAPPRPITASAPVATTPAVLPRVATADGPCERCAELGNYVHAMQKHGHEDEDTFLPAAAACTVRIKEVRPGANRTPVLERCTGCGDFFLYEIVYDYLATGSEDEQMMTRLSVETAQRYLDGWDGRS